MKKTYQAPVVTEWGEVMKLTQGSNNRWRRNQQKRENRRRERREKRDRSGSNLNFCGSH